MRNSSLSFMTGILLFSRRESKAALVQMWDGIEVIG